MKIIEYWVVLEGRNESIPFATREEAETQSGYKDNVKRRTLNLYETAKEYKEVNSADCKAKVLAGLDPAMKQALGLEQ